MTRPIHTALFLAVVFGCTDEKNDSDGAGWGLVTVSDGVEAGTDCDDGYSSIESIANDADCDGALTEEDCDGVLTNDV